METLGSRYAVEREVGRGGMAVVYLARDLRLERAVALKVLRPEISATLGPERFLREIKVAARLRHPYILKLHDSGESGGLLYYVMPFIEGPTLRQRLDAAKGRVLPVAEAVRIAQEVAEALDHAHRHHVIHRDIKPENILFEENHALVSDFGIARAVSAAAGGGERDTGSGVVIGTVDYMSPEQETGQPTIDARTDIYSLGIVLYEMLVGETPGPDRGVDSLDGRRPDLPAGVVRVLRRALARDPNQRFGTARELAIALGRTSRGSGIARVRRRSWAWGGLAGAALAAAAMYLWPRGGAPPPPDPTHIAVLYFDDLSPGGRLNHVATGLTHDLIESLARVPALRVTSPDGVRKFRGRPPALDSLAAELEVGTIVTGSVQESRGQLRVEVRLVDPLTGAQLASETFQRPQGELFALQDTVAAQVSDALRRRLGRAVVVHQRRTGAQDPAAWELLQRAIDLRDEASMTNSEAPAAAATLLLRGDSLAALAERADRRWTDPLLARAWLAYDLSGTPMQGNPTVGSAAGVTTGEWLRRAQSFAERALAMRPRDPEALTIRGMVRFRRWFVDRQDRDSLAPAEADLRAASAQPHRAQAIAWGTLSGLLQLQGQMEQALYAAQQAYATDAFLDIAPEILYRLFFTSFQLEREADAGRWCATGRARFPQDWLFLHCHLTLQAWGRTVTPDVADAWRAAEAVRGIAPAQYRSWVEPRLRMVVAAVIARAGWRDSAERVVAGARAAAPDDPELLYLEALVRIRLGEADSAIGLLARNLAASPDARPFLRRDVQLRALARHPAFRRLVGTDSLSAAR